MIARAGSGHHRLQLQRDGHRRLAVLPRADTLAAGIGEPDRDIFFSSKGHDVPGLYAVLIGARRAAAEQLLTASPPRRPPGHPDVGGPDIEANTGSLGMGISKAKGMALAKRLRRATAAASSC